MKKADKQLVVVTADQLAEWNREAATLIAKPDALKAEVMQALVVHGKILARIIEDPPPGRPGLIAQLKSIPLYRETMGTVLGVLQRRKSGTPPALPEAHGEAEVGGPPRGDRGESGGSGSTGPAGEAGPEVDG